jgi:hypothetical protein
MARYRLPALDVHNFFAIHVFDLVNNAHRAERLGFVSDSLADGWLEGLMKAREQGRFFCSCTGFLVSGQKSGQS